MNTHNFGEKRPPTTGAEGGEVVRPQASESPLKAFTERLKVRVKEIYNLHIKEEQTIIMFWINDIFVTLEPQLEEDSSLIYTTIDLAFMNDNLRVLGRLYVSSKEIVFDDEYKTLTCKFEEIGEDPIMLIDEQELIEYLNELSKINDYEDFEEFAENEFLSFSGLQP